jgi:hypothetical protein
MNADKSEFNQEFSMRIDGARLNEITAVIIAGSYGVSHDYGNGFLICDHPRSSAAKMKE